MIIIPNHNVSLNWQKNDLKQFSKFLCKVQEKTPTQVKTDKGLDSKKHNRTKPSGFSLPNHLDSNTELWQLKVSQKARVHGYIIGNYFHLVWLDRNHEVFPCK